jgi:hypothetical protein
MAKWISMILAQIENEFSFPFTGYKTMGLHDEVEIIYKKTFLICFKLLAWITYSHYCAM